MFKYDLVIFDWDGTLCDGEEQTVSSIQSIADKYRLAIPARDHILMHLGKSYDNLVRALYPKASNYDEIKEDLLLSLKNHPIHPLYPEVSKVVRIISDYCHTAIASNRPTEYIWRDVVHHGLDDSIIMCVGSDLVVNPKPHPDMLLEIINDYKSMYKDHPRTVMIGDSETDKEAAKGANIEFIRAPRGEIINRLYDLMED